MQRTPEKQQNTVWDHLLLLLGAPLYLFVNLYAWPGVPFLLGGDQIYFWTYAQRMLHGERVYQDFFQITPPGTDIFYLALFKVFRPHLWVTNAVVLLLGIALCWLCFSMARLLMERGFALLAAFLFLVLIYARLMNATHHWFSVLVVLCAARIIMPKRTLPRIAIAGALLAIASCFTQTAGFAGAIALLLAFAWDRSTWRALMTEQWLLLMSFGVVFAALNFYLALQVGPKQLWYFEINYPGRYLAYWFGGWFPGLPEPFSWRRLPHLTGTLFLYALLPVIYPLVLWHCWHRCGKPLFQGGREEGRVVLLSLVGLFLLLEIIPGVNWLRLYAVSMPGLILFIWAASRTKARRYIRIAGWALIAYFAMRQTWSRYGPDNIIARLPAGRAIVSGQKYETFSWLMQQTKPSDFLFQAAWPGVYLPLELRDPVFLDGLLADEQTRPEFVELSIEQLERKQVKYILWSPRLDHPDDPALAAADHLGPFRAYMKSRYMRAHVFSDRDELWERK